MLRQLLVVGDSGTDEKIYSFMLLLNQPKKNLPLPSDFGTYFLTSLSTHSKEADGDENCQEYLKHRDGLFNQCKNSLLALDRNNLSDAIDRLLELKSNCRFRDPDDDPFRLQRPDRAAIFDCIIRNYFSRT